jgi:hypothetical protein
MELRARHVHVVNDEVVTIVRQTGAPVLQGAVRVDVEAGDAGRSLVCCRGDGHQHLRSRSVECPRVVQE